MKKIKLGNKVVVSDPCYTLDGKLQQILDVKAGEYNVSLSKHDNNDGWGIRCSVLKVVHVDSFHPSSSFLNWEKVGRIGVDSGQAGIFDVETYRNDKLEIKTAGTFVPDNGDGEAWYGKMCDLTCGDEQWGAYDNGVVSSSGYGDGMYEVYVSIQNDEIVGVAIDFLVDENSPL